MANVDKIESGIIIGKKIIKALVYGRKEEGKVEE